MDRHFGNVIWTNHVLERLKQRGIKQSDAWAVWRRPDSSRFSSQKGAWVYQRKFGSQMVEVVAKKTHNGEWIILSVWSKTVFEEAKKHLSFWQTIKKLVTGI